MTHWAATYPGLNITSADMTYCHGVTPSVCCVVATPLEDTLTHGTLIFEEDDFPKVTFQDCAVFRSIADSSHVRRGIRMKLDIMDRRWKWRYTTISGRYNQRGPAGYMIDEVKKTYEELITLLLDALGETGYLLTLPASLPDPQPVDWSDARPDLELASLVEQIGCLVHLGQDNLVHIVPVGDGPEHPEEESSLIPNVDFTPLHYPETVEVICGPTVYQQAVALEAVGLDQDGNIKPLKELSYAKLIDGEWNKSYIPGTTGNSIGGPVTLDPGSSSVVSAQIYNLAANTVYKWYRIKELRYTPLALPNGETIEEIDNILPLLPTLAAPTLTDLAIYRRLADPEFGQRPYVWGSRADSFDGANWSEYGASSFTYPVTRDLDLDLERGLVRFNDFVFSTDDDGYFAEPDLYLMASFHARPNRTSDYYRNSYQYAVANGSPDAGVASVSRDDLYGVSLFNQDGGYPNGGDIRDYFLGWETERVANAYMNIYAAPQAAGKWVGIMTYPVAGNIHQMRWVVNGLETKTYGGKNIEDPVAAPLQKDRRIREMLSEELPLC